MPSTEQMGLRELILTIAQEQVPRQQIDAPLQQGQVFQEVKKRLGGRIATETQQEILTQWHDLIRTGYFAWGCDLNNPNPPFFHITRLGHRALERVSSDPGNPAGYLRHLTGIATLNPVSNSYLNEGLNCFCAGFYKAAAVMIGAAAESIILELRDITAERLKQLQITVPKGLIDWRVKAVLDALRGFLESKKSAMPKNLREELDGYWLAFAQQIRASRNDAGHPASVDPVTEDSAHAALLVFPELARFSENLSTWISNDLK